MRRAFNETKNINASNIYTRAVNPSYTGGDGVSLLNVAHPNFSGGTWQNTFTVTSELSQLAVEDILTLMMQSKDDRGFIEPLKGDKLVVHPNNLFNAQRIVKTPKAVGSNLNDINPVYTDTLLPGGIVSNPYLGGTGPWFITTDALKGMIYQEREPLEIWEDNDSDTRNYKIAAYERYVFLWANPRGLFGQNAA
jgi:phage major head subunit gpT-like protein